jgi:hypothetical protein
MGKAEFIFYPLSFSKSNELEIEQTINILSQPFWSATTSAFPPSQPPFSKHYLIVHHRDDWHRLVCGNGHITYCLSMWPLHNTLNSSSILLYVSSVVKVMSAVSENQGDSIASLLVSKLHRRSQKIRGTQFACSKKEKFPCLYG